MTKWWLPGVLLLLASIATAQDVRTHWCNTPRVHPLDEAFARAMQRAGGVNSDMHDALGHTWKGWDTELDRIYRALLQRFEDGDRASALRVAQHAWLDWDVAEAQSDLVQQAEGGSSGALIVTDLAIERRRARACILNVMLEESDASAD